MQDEILDYERLVCSRCGNLRSVCSDPNIDWHPQTSVCWPTASIEWGKRRLQEKYEQAKPRGDALHPLDGVSIWAAPEDLSPDSGDFD